MNRVLMPLAIIGFTLAANTATAREVDINVTLGGHSSAYANAPHYYPHYPQERHQQTYYPQSHYAPVYPPAYQAEVHHPPYPRAHVVVSPHHEYRPQWDEHGSRGYGRSGHHSRGRDH